MLKFYCYHFTWKKTTQQIIADIKTLCERTAQLEREEQIMLFVFVPAVSLEAVCAAIPGRKLVKISSQSVSVKPVSDIPTPEKLREIGADMAIIGLTDRRYLLGEKHEIFSDDLETVLNLGFKSMLCVGETRLDAESGSAANTIARQIKNGYSRIPYEAHYRIGTVYRPLWDFDRSYCPSEEYTLAMIRTIRNAVKETLPDFPIEMPLFFGGMLTADKLARYFNDGVIDGVYWDSEAISAEDFAKIINTIG